MAARNNAVVTEPTERVLVIDRVFNAPRELVFKCWTEPEHLARWIGPRPQQHDSRLRAAPRWKLSHADERTGRPGSLATRRLPRNRSAGADCPDVLLDGCRRQADAARDLADCDVCGSGRPDQADAASGQSSSRSPRAMIIGAAGAARSTNSPNILRRSKGTRSLPKGELSMEHRIATRDEWLAARKLLLAREKEHTRESDELNRQRRELPWVRSKRSTFSTLQPAR